MSELEENCDTLCGLVVVPSDQLVTCSRCRKFRELFASHRPRCQSNPFVFCVRSCASISVFVGKFAFQFSESRDYCKCSNRLLLPEVYDIPQTNVRAGGEHREKGVTFSGGAFFFCEDSNRGPHLHSGPQASFHLIHSVSTASVCSHT